MKPTKTIIQNSQTAKVFILANNCISPESTLAYGLQLAGDLHMPASFLGPNRGPFERLALSDPIKNLPQLSRETSKIWQRLSADLGGAISDKEILEMIEDEKPFLVIMEGTSNLNTLNEWFGTTETVIAEGTDIPVLIIPPKKSWNSVSKLLYIMDMEDAQRSNLEVMSHIVEKVGARLQVILISEKDMDDTDGSYLQLLDRLKQKPLFRQVSFHRIFGKKSAEEVEHLVEASGANWLVFERKNKNLYERIFDDYHSKRLILQSEIPVLVF